MQNDLFGDTVEKKNKRKETWEATFHACSKCMGPILKRRVSPTVTEVYCSVCGARNYGTEASLCWCGVNAGQYGSIFECVRNPEPRPSLPNLVLVREKKVEIKPLDVMPNRRVYCPDSYD